MIIEVLWTPNGGRLVVTMPDRGVLIRCEQATDTFVEVIKRIAELQGRESVDEVCEEIVGRSLISIESTNPPLQRNPEALKRWLDRIAERLGISLCAELFPSN